MIGQIGDLARGSRPSWAIALAALGLCASLAAVSAAPPEGGQSVPQNTSSASGARAAIPTFSKDVAPILYKNCVGCHRPGEIGPMSLLTYEDARPHAKAIRDEIGDGNMPPWHADPKHGKFANDRSLTAADRDTLLRWANNGAPKGDPKDLPEPPRFVDGWMIGEPDLVLTIPEYTVPAEGFVEYQVHRARHQPHRGPLDPGARSPARQSGSRSPRHRQRQTSATGAPSDRLPARRRDGCSCRADWRAARARRRAETGARREPLSPAAADRRLDRWLRAWHDDHGLQPRRGHAPAQGIHDRPADALHHQRQGSRRPDEDRALLREAAAHRGSSLRQPLEWQFHDSGRRAGLRGHGGDGHDSRRHAAADAAAHAPARQELGVHRDLSRRTLRRSSSRSRSTTSTGRPTTCLLSRRNCRREPGFEPSPTTTTRARTKPTRIRKST